MTSYCIWIVSPRGYTHSKAFDEIADSLQFAFKQLGYYVPLYKQPESPKVSSNTKIIVIAGHLLKSLPGGKHNPDWIIYNLEQIYNGSLWLSKEYTSLLKTNEVWDYSENNIIELRRMGVENIKLLELGYTSILEQAYYVSDKEIDVLFYGCLNERRSKILEELSNKGLRVKYLFDKYGSERDAYIARSKVIINIHFYESKVFEIVRCLPLLANKKCVVSELGNDKALEKPFHKGIYFSPYNKIVNDTYNLVKNDVIREAYEKKGYEYVRSRDQVKYLRMVLP